MVQMMPVFRAVMGGESMSRRHVLQEGVGHGRVQLLSLNEGRPGVTVVLRHGF